MPIGGCGNTIRCLIFDSVISPPFRSALRRIFEHDDSPGKTMVLCVSRIHSVESRLEGVGYFHGRDTYPLQ